MMLAGSLLAVIAEANAWRSIWGWAARLHPTQRHSGGLSHGQAQPGLLAAVTAQRLDGERRQGEDRAAGSGLDRPDGQLFAPANDSASAAVTVASRSGGVGEERGVDDGERLAEPDRAGVQVQVGPFQPAQLAVAGAGRRRQHRPGAKPW